MAEDELTAISGLLEKHRRVLVEQVGIATYDALASTDSQTVLDAMSRVRPRPTLTEVRRWQQQARRKRDEAAAAASNWERVATFVVSFEQRQVHDGLERRLVAEETELEVEKPPSSWSGWDCSQLDGWLNARVAEMDGIDQPEKVDDPGAAPEPAPRPTEDMSTEQVSPPAGVRPRMGRLTIEEVEIVDSAGRLKVAPEGRPRVPEFECRLPAWLEVRVAGAEPGQEILVALRLQRSGRPSWSPQDPVVITPEASALLALSEAAIGTHVARLVAWARDASAAPAVLGLGRLTIHPDLDAGKAIPG